MQNLTHSQHSLPCWKVGLASVNITPEQPIFLAGYASRDKPFEKVTTDLFAKALVLEDTSGGRAVIITTDLLGFPAVIAEPICERISEKTGLHRDQIVLSSSHTHTGPAIRLDPCPRGAMSQEDADRTVAYTNELHNKVVDVVDHALAKQQPARLSWGQGVVNFMMNRREFTPDGVVLGMFIIVL